MSESTGTSRGGSVARVSAAVIVAVLAAAYGGGFVVSGIANLRWWLLLPLVAVPAGVALGVSAWRERVRHRSTDAALAGWHRLLWLPAVVLLPMPVFMSAIMVQAELRPLCAFPAPDGNDPSCGDPLTGAEQAAWAAWWVAGGVALLGALACLLWARRSLVAAWASPLLTAAAAPVAMAAGVLTWMVVG